MRDINLFGRSSAPAAEVPEPAVEPAAPVTDESASVSLLTSAAVGPLRSYTNTYGYGYEPDSSWEWRFLPESMTYLGRRDASWQLGAEQYVDSDAPQWKHEWVVYDPDARAVLDACAALERALVDALAFGAIDAAGRDEVRTGALEVFPALAADLAVVEELKAALAGLSGVAPQLAAATRSELEGTLAGLRRDGTLARFTASAAEAAGQLEELTHQARLARLEANAAQLSADQQERTARIAEQSRTLYLQARDRVTQARGIDLDPVGG